MRTSRTKTLRTIIAALACIQAASARGLIDPHIAGGSEASPHSQPHQVALLTEENEQFCGGSLLSDRWVLTAAHCTINNFGMKVAAGAHNLLLKERSTIIVPVRAIFNHDQYSEGPKRNDISLLYLKHTLNAYIIDGRFVKPIRLPKLSDRGKFYHGNPVTMSGWGKESRREAPNSAVLKTLNTTVLSDLSCSIQLWKDFNEDDQLCTAGTGKQGACFGDSGGPLTEVESDGERTLIGVAIYIADSMDCMTGGATAFTKVNNFLYWIKRVTENEVHIRP